MLTVIIQAGGESRRMGRDKGLLPFLGQTLIERIVNRLSPLADELIVVTNHPEQYEFLHLPLIGDLIPGRGALGGMYTALEAASQPLAAVVACDMPFVSPKLLAAERDILIAQPEFDLVIPMNEQGMEPFHAVYRRQTCLPAVKSAVEVDLWRADSWFPQVNIRMLTVEEVRIFDPDLVAFQNINTPEDLIRAEQSAKSIFDGGHHDIET